VPSSRSGGLVNGRRVSSQEDGKTRGEYVLADSEPRVKPRALIGEKAKAGTSVIILTKKTKELLAPQRRRQADEDENVTHLAGNVLGAPKEVRRPPHPSLRQAAVGTTRLVDLWPAESLPFVSLHAGRHDRKTPAIRRLPNAAGSTATLRTGRE